MVDLVIGYSKRTDQVKLVQKVTELAAQAWPIRSDASAPLTRKVNMRLSDERVAALLREYESGATGAELADRFELARSTVIKLLKEHGVVVRRPRVSAEDTALAVELYRQGMRQIDIGERLGRDKTVVWHLLRRAGVL